MNRVISTNFLPEVDNLPRILIKEISPIPHLSGIRNRKAGRGDTSSPKFENLHPPKILAAQKKIRILVLGPYSMNLQFGARAMQSVMYWLGSLARLPYVLHAARAKLQVYWIRLLLLHPIFFGSTPLPFPLWSVKIVTSLIKWYHIINWGNSYIIIIAMN